VLKNNKNTEPGNVNKIIIPDMVCQMAIQASHLKPHTAVPPALYSVADREINDDSSNLAEHKDLNNPQ
jgi:hypothetical protein